MKTKTFKLTSLCDGVVIGKNRSLEVHYQGEVISRYPSISRSGGLKATLAKAKKEAYQQVNHFDYMPRRKFRCIPEGKLPYSVTTENGEKVHTFKLSDINA